MELQRPERSHKHQPDLYHETSVPNQLSLPRTNDDIANPERAAVPRRFPPWPAPFETAPVSPLPCSSPYFEQEADRNQNSASRPRGPTARREVKSQRSQKQAVGRERCVLPLRNCRQIGRASCRK